MFKFNCDLSSKWSPVISSPSSVIAHSHLLQNYLHRTPLNAPSSAPLALVAVGEDSTEVGAVYWGRKRPAMGLVGNAAGIIVVFDFDKTIIDCDSYNWVVDGLGATERFDELVHALPWHAALDEIFGEFHEQGITIQDIANRLKETPVDQHVVEGIKSVYALGCDLRVVSDANLFFVKTVLEHHGIYECFSETNTNPGVVDEEGRLRVSPYHDFCRSHHGCPLPSCPPNMCKGLIMERIQGEGKSRIIYLGDGKGDYCPSRKLTTKDYVMPRKNYPVWDLICSNPEAIEAEIHGWSDGKEQAEILVQLINKAVALYGHEDAEILSEDSAHPEVPPVL